MGSFKYLVIICLLLAGNAQAATVIGSAKFTAYSTNRQAEILGRAVLTGKAGGQTINGGTAAGENLTLSSTTNATKGNIVTSSHVKITNSAEFDGVGTTIFNVASGRTAGITFKDIASDGRIKMGHTGAIDQSSIDFWHGGSPIILTNVQANNFILVGNPSIAASGSPGSGGATGLTGFNSGTNTGQTITLQTYENYGADANIQPILALGASSFRFYTIPAGSTSWSALKTGTTILSILNNSVVATVPISTTQYNLSALNTAPASATAACAASPVEIRITAGYIYVCSDLNTWVRSALVTW